MKYYWLYFFSIAILCLVILSLMVYLRKPAPIETVEKVEISKPKMVILILGDSLTAGYGVHKTLAFPNQLEILLNNRFKTYKTTVINAGINGSTSASAYSRLKNHLQKNVPDVTIVALGANDGLRGLSVKSLKSNLQKAVDFLKSKKVKSIVAEIKSPPNYGEEYRKSFGKVFKELSLENNIPLISFFLDKVAGNPKLNLPDGIHPNELGHKIIAQNILPYLVGFYK